jgi:hypothetical protein
MTALTQLDEQTNIAARLASRQPADVDRMLVSQASSHGVELREGSRLRPIYDERGTFLGNDVVPLGWYAKGPDGGKAATADVVRKAMTPAPVDTIEEWLAELSVITARRAEDEFTGALRVDAYSRRLAGYPADVVKAAGRHGRSCPRSATRPLRSARRWLRHWTAMQRPALKACAKMPSATVSQATAPRKSWKNTASRRSVSGVQHD